MHVESLIRLLARGWMMGVAVELDGDDLKVTGPRTAENFVEEIRSRKPEVVAHLQAQGCGALHVRLEKWMRREGKAYCPRCDKYMGHIVNVE